MPCSAPQWCSLRRWMARMGRLAASARTTPLGGNSNRRPYGADRQRSLSSVGSGLVDFVFSSVGGAPPQQKTRPQVGGVQRAQRRRAPRRPPEALVRLLELRRTCWPSLHAGRDRRLAPSSQQLLEVLQRTILGTRWHHDARLSDGEVQAHDGLQRPFRRVPQPESRIMRRIKSILADGVARPARSVAHCPL